MFWVKPMADAGVGCFTFHIESKMPGEGSAGVTALINAIKAHGMKVGITLKPSTPLSEILPYVSQVDLVLVMTVEPGFSGQSFMPDMMEKVRDLRQEFPTLNISVDGGLSPSTVDAAAIAGAQVQFRGSYGGGSGAAYNDYVAMYNQQQTQLAAETISRSASSRGCSAQYQLGVQRHIRAR